MLSEGIKRGQVKKWRETERRRNKEEIEQGNMGVGSLVKKCILSTFGLACKTKGKNP